MENIPEAMLKFFNIDKTAHSQQCQREELCRKYTNYCLYLTEKVPQFKFSAKCCKYAFQFSFTDQDQEKITHLTKSETDDAVCYQNENTKILVFKNEPFGTLLHVEGRAYLEPRMHLLLVICAKQYEECLTTKFTFNHRVVLFDEPPTQLEVWKSMGIVNLIVEDDKRVIYRSIGNDFVILKVKGSDHDEFLRQRTAEIEAEERQLTEEKEKKFGHKC